MRLRPLPLLLITLGVASAGYGFYEDKQLQVGDKVVVGINLVTGTDPNAQLVPTLNVDLIIEVLKVEGETITGRVLSTTVGPLPAARVGIPVQFKKSAISRRVEV